MHRSQFCIYLGEDAWTQPKILCVVLVSSLDKEALMSELIGVALVRKSKILSDILSNFYLL